MVPLLLVGAATGAVVAGRLAERVGRRITLLMTAAVFIVGVLGAAAAPTFGFLVVTVSSSAWAWDLPPWSYRCTSASWPHRVSAAHS